MKEVKQVLVWRKDLNIRKGKIAAQIAHASLGALLEAANDNYENEQGHLRISFNARNPAKEWLDVAFTKIVVYVENEPELHKLHTKAKQAGLPAKMILDSGKTEFGGVPTWTCLGIGPAFSEDIDKITGELPLL